MSINDYSFSTVLVLGISTALYLHLNGRKQRRTSLETTLNQDSEGNKSLIANDPNVLIIGDHLTSLPNLIQKYLHRSLLLVRDGLSDDSINHIQTQPFRFVKKVLIEQEGSYLQNNSSWVSFHGTQEIITNPASPGFVFEENVKLLGDRPFFNQVKIHVRDSYQDGKSDVSVDFMKIFPIVQHADISAMNEGHLEQWMSNIPVYPTSFIYQNGGLLKWTPDDATVDDPLPTSYPGYPKVRATITEPHSEDTAQVDYAFDERGLIVAASGILHPERRNYPKYETKDCGENVRIWERRFLDYKEKDGLLVPTKIDFGWWDDEMKEFCIHVKIVMTNIVYTF